MRVTMLDYLDMLEKNIKSLIAVEKQYKSYNTADKAIFNRDNGIFNLDELESLSNGRSTIIVQNVPFKCYFHLGSNDRLIVFLCGKGITPDGKKIYEAYSRWSYDKLTESSTIVIDDPMRVFDEVLLGWYVGTSNTNYRVLASVLIKKISSIYNICESDISIIGSSGGGTAAVYIGSLLNNSTVVAINPQISMHERPGDLKIIEAIWNYSVKDDPFHRDDMFTVIKNSKCNYIFLVNMYSLDDYTNLSLLLEKFNHYPCYGVCKKNRITTWTYIADSTEMPHTIFETRPMFKLIEHLINNNTEFFITKNQDFYNYINESVYEYYNIRARYGTLKNLIQNNTDISLNDVDLGRYYKTGHYLSKSWIASRFYFRQALINADVRGGHELFDVSINDSVENQHYVFNRLQPLVDSDIWCKIRLARSYKDGKGVKKDLMKAIALLYDACKVAPSARIHLCYALFEYGEGWSTYEANRIVKELLEEGDKKTIDEIKKNHWVN